MATPEEIAEANANFQEKVVVLKEREAKFHASRETYLADKQQYIDAIMAVDEADNRLEALTQEYEPPSAPEPA